jgi:IS4 transposase
LPQPTQASGSVGRRQRAGDRVADQPDGVGSTTIAAIYRDRWEIELFFKALKQNLKLKSFVGTSENALRIQIWTALIAILLLKWLHHLSKAKWSLSNLASMLRLNLFTYRDLTAWLDNPFGTPPVLPESQQLALTLA